MFKRSFKVTFKPLKNNFVILSDNYYNLVSTYDTGCLALKLNSSVYYVTWIPHAGNKIDNNEIGINAKIAKEIGLHENEMVQCSLITDVAHLDKVYVTPVSARDWEIIEHSSEKLCNTILDQITVVNINHILTIWVNRSTPIELTIDRTKPHGLFGRIDYKTEFIVNPYPTDMEYNNADTASKYTKSASESLIAAPDSGRRPSVKTSQQLSKSTLKHLNQLKSLEKRLLQVNTRSYEFRVVEHNGDDEERQPHQISDVYIYGSEYPEFMNKNDVYLMETKSSRQYYVRVHLNKHEHDSGPHNTMGLSKQLLSLLDMKELETVTLKAQTFVTNFVENIKLYPSAKIHYKTIETAFKRFVLARAKSESSNIILNQDEKIMLEDDIAVTISLLPEHFSYCVIDANFLKEGKVYAADPVRRADPWEKGQEDEAHRMSAAGNSSNFKDSNPVSNEIAEIIKRNLCLEKHNEVCRYTNVLITGQPGTGKSDVVRRVLELLEPYYCYCETFHCSRHKGRKVESIQRDLRNVFTNCLQNGPSIMVLDSIEALAYNAEEHSLQDSEYHNRLSDILCNAIAAVSNTNSVVLIATADSEKSLNARLHSSRGNHIFNYIYHIPNLERSQRENVLHELCRPLGSHKLNLQDFSALTEGYNNEDLEEFIDRAVFYAYRNDKNNPVLTNTLLLHSLDVMNSCNLHDNERTANSSDLQNATRENVVADAPGLEAAVSALEEVILLPSKYPAIFNHSPMRNQAGVLLYGAPGTGKTYLIEKIATAWNLRIISVKGPELLAKYIGQSEENVRALFNRARNAKPCVLFFDEFDSLAPRRGHDSTGVTDRVVNQLLTELDGVESTQGVIIIAATSRPELLDPALMRSGRIDRLIECGFPNEQARKKIFEKLSEGLNVDASVDFAQLAAKTQNYTGADIRSILISANMVAIKQAIDKFGDKNLPEKVFVTQKHLMDSYRTTRPTLSPAKISEYQATYARFSSGEVRQQERASKRATLA